MSKVGELVFSSLPLISADTSAVDKTHFFSCVVCLPLLWIARNFHPALPVFFR